MIAANELHPGLTAESGLMWQAFGATPEDIRLEPPPVFHVDVLDVYIYLVVSP